MKTLTQYIFTLLFVGICFVSEAQIQFIQKRIADKRFDKQYYAKAVDIYEKLAAKNDSNAYVTKKLSECYRQMNKYEKAEIWYERLFKIKASETIDYYYYASVLMNNEKYEKAQMYMKLFYNNAANDSRAQKQIINQGYISDLLRDSSKYIINHLDLNSSNSDFAPAYYNNNLVFASSRVPANLKIDKKYKWNNEPFLDLYMSKNPDRDSANGPIPYSKSVNTNYHESNAVFTSDGKEMYFTRNNYLKRGYQEGRVNRLKIFHASFNDSLGWINISALKFNSDKYSCGHPTLSADGKTMFFASDMDGGMGGSDIYVTLLENGEWSTPENLGKEINTEGDEMFPFIHRDGTLYYASDGLPGLGGLDIFVAKKSGNGFEAPKNLGYPLNSSRDDFGLIVDKHKMSGYYASNRAPYMNDDIYKVYFTPKPPKAVNDEYFVDNDTAQLIILPVKNDIMGDFGGLHITDYKFVTKPGREIIVDAANNKFIFKPTKKYFGEDTIYYTIADTFSVLPGKSNAQIVIHTRDPFYGIRALVVVKGTEEPVPGVKIDLLDKNGEIVILKDSTIADGTFACRLDKNTEYMLKLDKPGFLTKRLPLSTIKKPEGYQDVKEVIEMEKKEVGITFAFTINFDLGKSDIRKDAAKVLDEKIYSFLTDNPTVRIELSAHTDARGDAKSNEALSQKRANSVVAYLVKKGIAAERMEAKGYGESKLLNKCGDGVKCTEQEHAVNRRVEMKVLGY